MVAQPSSPRLLNRVERTNCRRYLSPFLDVGVGKQHSIHEFKFRKKTHNTIRTGVPVTYNALILNSSAVGHGVRLPGSELIFIILRLVLQHLLASSQLLVTLIETGNFCIALKGKT